jgi:hypothetical protein
VKFVLEQSRQVNGESDKPAEGQEVERRQEPGELFVGKHLKHRAETFLLRGRNGRSVPRQ